MRRGSCTCVCTLALRITSSGSFPLPQQDSELLWDSSSTLPAVRFLLSGILHRLGVGEEQADKSVETMTDFCDPKDVAQVRPHFDPDVYWRYVAERVRWPPLGHTAHITSVVQAIKTPEHMLTLLAEALTPDELAAVCKPICLQKLQEYFENITADGRATFQAIVQHFDIELRAEDVSQFAQHPSKAPLLLLRLAAKRPDLLTKLRDVLIRPCLHDALDRMFRGLPKDELLHKLTPKLEPHVQKLGLEWANVELALMSVGSLEELGIVAEDPEAFLTELTRTPSTLADTKSAAAKERQAQLQIDQQIITEAMTDPTLVLPLLELFVEGDSVPAVIKLAVVAVTSIPKVSLSLSRASLCALCQL